MAQLSPTLRVAFSWWSEHYNFCSPTPSLCPSPSLSLPALISLLTISPLVYKGSNIISIWIFPLLTNEPPLQVLWFLFTLVIISTWPLGCSVQLFGFCHSTLEPHIFISYCQYMPYWVSGSPSTWTIQESSWPHSASILTLLRPLASWPFLSLHQGGEWATVCRWLYLL